MFPPSTVTTAALFGPGSGDRLLTLAVGVLLGGLAIHVAARYVIGDSDYGQAVLTALLGAVVWALLAPFPLLGSLLALVAWVGVIKWRYPCGWLSAAGIGVGAWVVAVVVLAALELAGVGSVSVIGVPGT